MSTKENKPQMAGGKIIDDEFFTPMSERGACSADMTDLLDLEVQTWPWAKTTPKSKTKQLIKNLCIDEVKEFLNGLRVQLNTGAVKPSGKGGKDLTASYLKQLNCKKTYKAMCDRRADARTRDLDDFSTKYKGWWDRNFDAKAIPKEEDFLAKGAENFYFYFPPKNRKDQSMAKRILAEDLWRFAKVQPKETSKKEIKAILKEQAKDHLESIHRRLENGNFFFNDDPTRNKELVDSLLTQLSDPTEVKILVEERVAQQIAELNLWWRFEGWWEKTFSADEFPQAEDGLPEEFKGKGAQTFDNVFGLGTSVTMLHVPKGEKNPMEGKPGYMSVNADKLKQMLAMGINPFGM